jgi:hypothetical protein
MNKQNLVFAPSSGCDILLHQFLKVTKFADPENWCFWLSLYTEFAQIFLACVHMLGHEDSHLSIVSFHYSWKACSHFYSVTYFTTVSALAEKNTNY